MFEPNKKKSTLKPTNKQTNKKNIERKFCMR